MLVAANGGLRRVSTVMLTGCTSVLCCKPSYLNVVWEVFGGNWVKH